MRTPFADSRKINKGGINDPYKNSFFKTKKLFSFFTARRTIVILLQCNELYVTTDEFWNNINDMSEKINHNFEQAESVKLITEAQKRILMR